MDVKIKTSPPTSMDIGCFSSGDVVYHTSYPDRFYLVLDSTYFPKEDKDKVFIFSLQLNCIAWVNYKTSGYVKVKATVTVER